MTDSQKWMSLSGSCLAAYLIYLLSPILTPFALAALFAYLGDPLADKLESWKLNRTLAVVVVFLVMALFLSIVLVVLVPMLERQISSLVTKAPLYVTWVKSNALPFIQRYVEVDLAVVEVDQITALMKSHWQQAGGLVASVLGSISRSGFVVLAWAMNLVLVPVVGFYLLRDWDALVSHIHGLVPRRNLSTFNTLIGEVDTVLGAFLKGQFSVMFALGGIYISGLFVIGLDLALLIGLMAGFISFIPYLGTLLGVAAACFAVLYQFGDVWHLVAVLVVFGIGQMLEGMVLTPWLVGDRVGLHPVMVIFSVLAGGQLFGFLGILLALPVAAVAMVVVRHLHREYKESNLYGFEAASPEGAESGDAG